MRKGQPRRWAVYPFTDRELRVVELRAQGMRPKEIAKRLGLTVSAVYNRLWRVYGKAGLAGGGAIRDWAVANAFDEPLAPEPPQPKPPANKPGRKRIYLGRIRRARL